MNPAASRWQPGAKVICTNDRFPPEAIPCFSSLPVRGRLYTLTSVAPAHDWKTRAPTWSVKLLECPAIATARFRNPSFDLTRFRLLPDHFALTALQCRRTGTKRHAKFPGAKGSLHK